MVTRSESHFVNIPGNNIGHSRLDLGHYNITSFNVGQLVPLTQAIEVLPGDNFDFGVSSMVRLSTLISPIMDNLFMDIFCFYVSFRVLWEHYVNFEGENDTAPWVSSTTYSMPQIEAPSGGWTTGTIADYFRMPIGVEKTINALPFRAYAKIVKDWFYDQNVQTPPDVVVDDTTIIGSNGTNYVTDLIKGGMPFIVGKTHDIFTSCLPAPQRSNASVVLPLGENAYVYTGNEIPFSDYKNYVSSSGYLNDMKVRVNSVEGTDYSSAVGYLGVGSSAPNTVAFSTDSSFGVSSGAIPTNLYADLSSATATTINDLRLAFQTQRLFELMARGGSRYYEILASQWGISAPQGVIQRSEYLGGHRFNLRVETVAQTSETSATSPQGNLTAYSSTTHRSHDFHKAFTERGYIICLGCVRYQHTYTQGIPKEFLRKDKFHFYHNAFSHIGEQGLTNAQIYAQGTDIDDEIFGYNEAWVEYRYIQNGATGEMRPQAATSLDYWHFADNFTSLPTLSSDFIKESKENVDRVLAVSSSVSNQLQCEFKFNINAIRPMPLYSIPGLIDHL